MPVRNSEQDSTAGEMEENSAKITTKQRQRCLSDVMAVCHRLQAMQVDDTEYMCLKAITLFQAGIQ